MEKEDTLTDVEKCIPKETPSLFRHNIDYEGDTKLLILSRSKGRSNPVVRHWERAHYRHIRHKSLGHVLQKGDCESQ